MIQFIQNILTQAFNGNFSFFILLVLVLQQIFIVAIIVAIYSLGRQIKKGK